MRNPTELIIPKIFGLTASPVLDIENSKNPQIEPKIQELCTNLDADFVKYNIEESKKYIKEATIQVESFDDQSNYEQRASQFLQEKVIGEKWLSHFEDNQNEYEKYKEIIQLYKKFYEFQKQYYKSLSELNQEIVDDLEKIICLHCTEVDAQLGKYSVSLFLKDVNDELQKVSVFQNNNEEMQELKKIFKTQVDIFIQSVDKSDKNISKKFKFLYDKLKNTMILDQLKFETYKIQQKYYDDNIFHKKERDTNVENYIKENQSMVLVFVEQKIIIKYLQKLLQIWMDEEDKDKEEKDYIFRFKKIVCLTGQANFQDRKKNKKNINLYKNTEFTSNNDFLKANEALLIKSQRQKEQDKLATDQIDMDSLKEKINDHQKSTQRLILVNLDFDVTKQSENIEAFRKKELQIILSTSVTEEGFDIPSCNLVISFNKISNLKSFVQIKGRARKQDSQFLILAKDDQQKQNYETDIEEYKELILQIKEMAPYIKPKEIQIRKNYKYKIVKETGAILNTNWSVNLFHTYANQLVYSYDSNIKGPFYFYIEITNVGYICQIIVPTKSEQKFYCSYLQPTKEDAKKDACFQAIIILYRQFQIFDQYLRNAYQKVTNKSTDKKESIFEDVKDEKLTKILQKYCISFIDKKQKCKTSYFESVMGQCFKQKFFISQLQPSPLSVEQMYTFQLYFIKFNDKGNKIPTTGFKGNYNSELGIIHSTRIPITETIKYYLQIHEDDVSANLIFQKEFQLNQEQYGKLMLINRFLNSVALEKDIEFYAEFTEIHVNPLGKLFKDRGKNTFKQEQYKFDNSDEINALLTVLKPCQDNQNMYEINFEHIEAMIKYIDYMKMVYKIRNKTKLNEQEKKTKIESIKNKSDLDPFADQKVSPYYDCINFFDSNKQQDPSVYLDASEKIVLQSIQSGKHLNRFIYYGCKRFEEVRIEYEQKKKFDTLKKIYNLKNSLEQEEVKFTSNPNHMVLQVMIFKKYLKSQINMYLKRTGFLQEKSYGDYKHFPHQYTIFPLNVGLLMKLTILHKTFLYQIRDTFGVHHFQQIHLPKLFKKAQKNIEKDKKYSYNLVQIPHFFVENFKEILEVMRKSEKYNQFCKKYDIFYNQIEENKIKKFDNQFKKYPPISESYDKYQQNILQIKISELKNSLTSLEYAVNNKEQSLERYEFLGDTVLKCLSSTQIYFQYPQSMEDHLHVHRTIIIQNKNLAQISIKKKIFKYILAAKIEILQPLGIKYEVENIDEEGEIQEKIPDEYEIADLKKNNNQDNVEGENQDNQDQINEINMQLRKKPSYRHIKGKTLADTLESIIGVFFDQKKDLSLCQYLLFSLQVLNKPDLTFNHVYEETIIQKSMNNPIYIQLKQIENKLGYTFKNINLLFQAVTLPSIEKLCCQIPKLKNTNFNKLHQFDEKIQKFDNLEQNEIVDEKVNKENIQNVLQNKNSDEENLKNYNLSNQRLEFLGDAVLDLIIVEYLFYKYPSSDPGNLTQMKTQLVQNKTLCLINLKKGFYDYIIGSIQQNQEDIKLLLSDIDKFEDDISTMYDTKYNQTLIKTLGDIIESLVGAIFIDNNLDYEITKKIVMGSLFDQILSIYSNQDRLLINEDAYVEKINKKNDIQAILKDDESDQKEGKIKYYLCHPQDEKQVIQEVYANGKIEAMDQIVEQISKNKHEKK